MSEQLQSTYFQIPSRPAPSAAIFTLSSSNPWNVLATTSAKAAITRIENSHTNIKNRRFPILLIYFSMILPVYPATADRKQASLLLPIMKNAAQSTLRTDCRTQKDRRGRESMKRHSGISCQLPLAKNFISL